MNDWWPDADVNFWPRSRSCKGMKAAKAWVICPIQHAMVAPVTDCYGCRIGFSGDCEKLNAVLEKEPAIIEEIYRPVPELRVQKLESDYILYKNKVYDLKKVKKVKSLDSTKLFGVTAKYSLTMRFIPKYEQFDTEHTGRKFFNERLKTIVDFSQIVKDGNTGDILYSLNKDEKLLDILKLMETLNG